MTSVIVTRRCLRMVFQNNKHIRSFGSAAAAQLDYDYDDYYPHYNNTNNNKTSEEEDWERRRSSSMNWVIMGDPTNCRHVYADRLSKILHVPRISIATLLRQDLNPNSTLYKKIASCVNNGNLVPEDDVIFSLLSKRLEDGYSRGESGFILDGIPKTTLQAEILDQIADIDLVLNLKSTDEVVPTKTTLNWGIYSTSRHFHSMPVNVPFKPHLLESHTIVNDKLRVFEQQKKPLEEYYRRQNKLFDFQVTGAPGDTWEGLLAALHLRNTNVVTSAANFSHKLTA